MKVVSPKITLRPGFQANGKNVTTATVKLLTRAERETLNGIADLEEQNKKYFVAQINSFDGNEDRTFIEEASTLLLYPDEERLNQAMNDLIEEYRDPRFKSGGHKCPRCGADVICERAVAAVGKE